MLLRGYCDKITKAELCKCNKFSVNAEITY